VRSTSIHRLQQARPVHAFQHPRGLLYQLWLSLMSPQLPFISVISALKCPRTYTFPSKHRLRVSGQPRAISAVLDMSAGKCRVDASLYFEIFLDVSEAKLNMGNNGCGYKGLQIYSTQIRALRNQYHSCKDGPFLLVDLMIQFL
jgi:hypothetical protein